MSAETNPLNDITTPGNEKKPAQKRPEGAASGQRPEASAAVPPRKPASLPGVGTPLEGRASASSTSSTNSGAPAWPTVDVGKFFEESRERLKDAFDQASGRFESVRSTARDTSEVLQDCHSATIAGLKEINEHALEGVQADMDRLFDYGRHLAEVKSVPEALEAHTTFVRESFEKGLERARTMSEMSANLFKSTFEPFQSGMANVLEQAKKRTD